MIRRLLVLMNAIIFAGTLSAQHVTLKGDLADRNFQSKIEYATIAAYHSADSTFAAGGLSDSLGCFSFKLPKGAYYLEVSHINYQKLTQQLGVVVKDTTFATIGMIQQMNSLDEVVIRGTTPPVRITNEKSVFKVSEIPASSGGRLKDVLKNIPSLTVDFNDEVLINGTQAKFLIDGREISSSELASYSPSQIASIEVIANPTAKYDASGLSGIIQLKTKRNYSAGISGAVNASVAHDVQSGAANLSYNRTKWKLSSNFSLMNDYQHGFLETTLDNDFSQSKIKASVQNITGNIGIDYSLDEKRLLYASYQYLDFGYVARDSSDRRTGKTDMQGITHQFATGYTHQFTGNKGKLSANFYYNETSPATKSWLNDRIASHYYSMNNYNNSYIGTLDYSLPLTGAAGLETGLKTHTRNISIWQAGDSEEALTDNHFSMRESILAAYILMNSKWGKFNMQLGVRGEINLATSMNDYRKWDIFPNLSLDYTLNEHNTFKVGYSNRLNRPSAADINPFKLHIDPTSSFHGNPSLRPEYSHNFFVDYVNTYQSGTIKVSTYYRLVNNLITKTFIHTNQGILYSPVNIGTAHFYGMDFIAMQNFGEIFSVMASAGTSSVFIPHGTDKKLRNVHSFNLGLTVDAKLPHGFRAQAVAKYSSGILSVGSSSQSPVVQGLAIGLPQLLTELCVSKLLLKDNMSLSLRVTDPFRLQQNGYKVYSDNSLRKNIYRMETRYVYFSLSYRFNNFKASRRSYEDGGVGVF